MKEACMSTQTKTTLFFTALLALCCFTNSLATFLTAQEYLHPDNGTKVWLFGDIHCDVDLDGTMTRLQQHIILEKAAQKDAAILAENVDYSLYSLNPAAWLIAFGLDAFVFYKAYTSSSYGWAGFATLLTASHVYNLNKEWQKTYKPTCSFEKHIQDIKKNSLVTSLPAYLLSPLFNIVPEAQKRGIDAHSIEFRYHSTPTAIENLKKTPVIGTPMAFVKKATHWVYRTATGNAERYQLTLEDYCIVNDRVLQEITDYPTDNPTLKAFYTKCIDAYHASYMTTTLRAMAKENLQTPLATILPSLVERTQKDTATVWKDFMEHNLSLLDARLVHSISNARKKTVFVCAGAEHVRNISKTLQQLGYRPGALHGKDNIQKLEERGAIGRTFIQTADLEYVAIDLEKALA